MPMLDPTKYKSRVSFNHAGTFYALAADFARGRLYAGSDDFAVHVFDPAGQKKQPVELWKKHESYVSAVVCVAQQLISASYDRRLIWWDLATGKAIRTVEAHTGWIRSLAATRDARQVVSAGDDMVLRAWDATTGRSLRLFEGHARYTPQGHATALYALAISPDNKYVAGGDRVGAVCVWELDTGKLIQRFEVPVLYTYDPVQRKRSIGGIRSLAFSSDGNLLAAGGIGQVGNVDGLAGPAHVELWNWRQPRRCCTLAVQGHKAIINCLQFHPALSWLLGGGGGSDNGVLAFWNVSAISPGMQEQKDAVAGLRIKVDGHIHALCLDPQKNDLYAAGYRKLEVFSLSV